MLHVGILIIKTDYPFKIYGKNKIKIILRQFYRLILFFFKLGLKKFKMNKNLTVYVKNLEKFDFLVSFFKKENKSTVGVYDQKSLHGR